LRPLGRRLLLACLAATGCAAGLADSRGGGERRLCLGGECYALGPLGPGWRVVQRRRSEIGFYDGDRGAVIHGSADCPESVDTMPLQSLTDHLLIGYTERRVRSSGVVPLCGREALRTVVDLKLDGVPMVLDIYVFKRDGCAFELSFAAAPAGYSMASPEFERFVLGFRPSPS